jgi:hypothetical protein
MCADIYICISYQIKEFHMLNIGLIGNTETLEPFVKRIKKNKNVNVIGKASVGSSNQLNSFHFSIPEMNRVELIERSDVLLIDNSTLSPFKMLSDIIKKSKHIFTVEYLNITIDECSQLVKLANESGSVVQISNPYYFSPVVQWMNSNVSMPVFLDIIDFASEGEREEKLFPIILMLVGLTGISPKKVGAVTFNSAPNKSDFTNVRLEFGDASVVNISFGNIESLEEFKIRGYAKNQFIAINFSRKIYNCNNTPIDLTDYMNVNEFDWFTDSIGKKNKKKSSIEDYLIALHLTQKINKKITQFFAQ